MVVSFKKCKHYCNHLSIVKTDVSADGKEKTKLINYVRALTDWSPVHQKRTAWTIC